MLNNEQEKGTKAKSSLRIYAKITFDIYYLRRHTQDQIYITILRSLVRFKSTAKSQRAFLLLAAQNTRNIIFIISQKYFQLITFELVRSMVMAILAIASEI